MEESKSKTNWGRRIIFAYAVVNGIIFLVDPYSSPWHYHTHNPVPIKAVQPGDSALLLREITGFLAAIDLAYGARTPTAREEEWIVALRWSEFLFFPSTLALIIKDFIGYIGPATSEQMAFTMSVKQRYNHLARLAVSKGMKEDGYLFEEEPGLEKVNVESFESLRSAAAGNR